MFQNRFFKYSTKYVLTLIHYVISKLEVQSTLKIILSFLFLFASITNLGGQQRPGGLWNMVVFKKQCNGGSNEDTNLAVKYIIAISLQQLQKSLKFS